MTTGKVDPKTERSMGAYRQLRRAAETLGELLNHQLGEFGVTPGQFRVLEALLLNGPMRLDKLGNEIFYEARTMRYLTTSLAKQALIVKRTAEENKRQPMIHLTPEGRALITEIFPRQAKLIRAQMIALGSREQDILRRLCEKLAEGNVKRFFSEITMVREGEE
jgi:MarR family transcriptional regulator, 2-MHQ and catechol-resistance regulon repressor